MGAMTVGKGPKIPARRAGRGGGILPVLTITGLAALAGSGFGLFLGKGETGLPSAYRAASEAASSLQGEPRPDIRLQAVPSILTNLAGPGKTYIRLEATLALDPDASGAEALAAKIGEDFLAYLRTTTLAQIEGPGGFQFLREDLIDRARIRSEGKVRDVIIQAFAVE